MNTETLHRRITLLSALLIVVSGGLIIRLLSFQFYMNPTVKENLESNAQSRYSRTIEVMPSRGQIYDRNGNLLAVNTYNYRVGVSPGSLNNRQEAARELAPLLRLPEDEVYDLLSPNDDGTFPPYVLLSSLIDFDAGQAIMELHIDGVVVDPIPARIYPQGALTAQIVGFFAGSSDTREGRGYWGVEGYYQPVLAGQSKRVTQSLIPLLDEGEIDEASVRDGVDLVLTIDRDLQYLAQEVLDKAIVEQGADGGTILIMNPRTGEILAVANASAGEPLFNPEDASNDNMKRARNPAISNIYEPGSVFKILTMAIAIESGIDPNTWTYYDPGCFNQYGIDICNWDYRSRGNPSFAQVFIDSLNTGTSTLYMQMDYEYVYQKLEEFGIGVRTGIDLQGEEEGIVNEPGESAWSEANYLTASFGQGVSVTTLQMLTAVNAVANDGLIMQPHIVKARIDGGKVIETPISARSRPISEKTAHQARDIMVQVVNAPQSEDLYDFPGYSVAGKTGTAQVAIPGGYSDTQSIASFVGFLPADDPVVSVLVKLDSPDGYWGSKTAAPVFQELVERLVVLMEIPPDNVRYQLVAQGGDPFRREY